MLISVGTYDPSVSFGPLVAPDDLPLAAGPTGLDLVAETRRWDPEEPTKVQLDTSLLTRLYVDEDGIAQLDRLELENPLAGVRVRPLLGDSFDLALLGGQLESTWLLTDIGPAQVHLYTPGLLTLLGFSNTDFDPDARLKHYVAIGAGPGARVSTRIAGPVGLTIGIEALARTLNRHQGESRNQVRHEVSATTEVGVGWFGPRASALVTGWGELSSQWETRDAGGHDGVNRQYAAAGARLTLISSLERPETFDEERMDELQQKLDEQGVLDVDDL